MVRLAKHNIYIKITGTFILFSCIYFPLSAQEKIRALSVNPVIINARKALGLSKILKVSSFDSELVQLPFTDNFTLPLISSDQHFADSTYWNNSIVYINSNLPVNPPEYGVASLGIYDAGRSLYTNDVQAYMGSDTLTSNPVNLNCHPGDSVYLSFYYQSKGYGYFNKGKELMDSLMLDFYTPVTSDSGTWTNIWSKQADTSNITKAFTQKRILITDSIYLQTGFRLRFHNLNFDTILQAVSIDSIGIWNIANIYLGKNRRYNDTLPKSIVDSLPFIDDFSRGGPYPDPQKWADKDVYINSTFPLKPPTIGVATFDALNSEGLIYPNIANTPFQADKLTSNAINLSKFVPGDSLYLSFFFEPKGIGGAQGGMPYAGDSLILEFFDSNPMLKDSTRWQKVWFNPGGDSTAVFTQVLIPITDPVYFNQNFRFRFRNYCTIISNADQGEMSNGDFWHVDYVRLNKGRNYQDTAIDDVAFIYPLTSLLVDYQSIPWDQFQASQNINIVVPQITGYCKNNDSIPLTNVFSITVSQINSASNIIQYPTTTENDTAYEFFSPPPVPIIDPFNSFTSTDSISFEVKGFLTTNSSDINKWNDTARFKQVFKNYYAYDDGSAESGYGLEGSQSENAMAAMQFTAYQQDSLTGIGFYFVPTENNISRQYTFTYAVWNDNNGQPGQIVYQSSGLDSVLYGPFPVYKLDSTVLVSGKFYVGWIQTDPVFLNIGLDLNTNQNPTKLFLNYQSPWQNSVINGTVMIRPVVGSITNNYLGVNKAVQPADIVLYPNPASDIVYIKGLDNIESVNITIYNITGKTILEGTLNESGTIDTSNFPGGMYFVVLKTEAKSYSPLKLIVQK